jgi:hypothetical protein
MDSVTRVTGSGRPVAASVAELLAGASSREPMDKHAESLSGSPFERVVIDGERYVVKYLSTDLDWIMRATGDYGCRALVLWRTGMLDALPDCLDTTIVAVAHDRERRETALLMRDVGPYLVEVADGRLRLDQHLRFLDHMAALHATFWGLLDHEGLLPLGMRYTALTPLMAEIEAAGGRDDAVPRMIPAGWEALAAAAPEPAEHALALATEPWPLVEALEETPATFVHGDWKAGNLGSLPDGRTVLLDWAWPGRAGPGVDLAWYLAVNCDLLPQSKEQTIGAFRDALHRRGVDTAGWWERQLELALLGAFVQLGWSKTGDAAELAWWVDRVLPVARDLR